MRYTVLRYCVLIWHISTSTLQTNSNNIDIHIYIQLCNNQSYLSWSLRPNWFGWFKPLHWTHMWTLYEHRVVPPNLLHSYIWFVRYVNYFESLVTFLMNHSSQHLHPAFVFTIAMAICPALGSAAELTVVLFIHLMVGGLKIHICRLKFIDCHQSNMLKGRRRSWRLSICFSCATFLAPLKSVS